VRNDTGREGEVCRPSMLIGTRVPPLEML